MTEKEQESNVPNEDEDLEGHFQLGQVIGKGGYGTVIKALNIETGKIVALKRFPLRRISKERIDDIMAEAETLRNLKHPNILEFYGYAKTSSYLYLILEYVEEGSLSKVIDDFGKFPEKLSALYVEQVLNGLVYLHSKNVAHRDIKGSNILITKEGKIKMADFGVAATINESERRFSVVGTPYWMAPEVIDFSGHSTQSDIWSVGCLVQQLTCGEPPYFDQSAAGAMYSIVQDEHPPIPEQISDDLKDFLLKCWKKNPDERPTAKQLLDHPWITNRIPKKPPMPPPLPVITPPEPPATPANTPAITPISSPILPIRELVDKKLAEAVDVGRQRSPTLTEVVDILKVHNAGATPTSPKSPRGVPATREPPVLPSSSLSTSKAQTKPKKRKSGKKEKKGDRSSGEQKNSSRETEGKDRSGGGESASEDSEEKGKSKRSSKDSVEKQYSLDRRQKKFKEQEQRCQSLGGDIRQRDERSGSFEGRSETESDSDSLNSEKELSLEKGVGEARSRSRSTGDGDHAQILTSEESGKSHKLKRAGRSLRTRSSKFKKGSLQPVDASSSEGDKATESEENAKSPLSRKGSKIERKEKDKNKNKNKKSSLKTTRNPIYNYHIPLKDVSFEVTTKVVETPTNNNNNSSSTTSSTSTSNNIRAHANRRHSTSFNGPTSPKGINQIRNSGGATDFLSSSGVLPTSKNNILKEKEEEETEKERERERRNTATENGGDLEEQPGGNDMALPFQPRGQRDRGKKLKTMFEAEKVKFEIEQELTEEDAKQKAQETMHVIEKKYRSMRLTDSGRLFEGGGSSSATSSPTKEKPRTLRQRSIKNLKELLKHKRKEIMEKDQTGPPSRKGSATAADQL
ncbi:Suppressor of Sensor Kinase (SLN1) [Balamuthia mandrillaris]